MNPKNVKPKLHFEVGEKVVICATVIKFSGYGTYNWPNKSHFTFTTIKEVKDNGEVVTEEGYVYRQAYETQFGDTEVFDYFRIKATPKGDYKFNSKGWEEYERNHHIISEKASFFIPTLLLKYDKEWDEKAERYEKLAAEEKAKKDEAKRIADEAKARKQPYVDAYNAEIKPLEEQLYQAKVKAWKKHYCAHCIHNCGNHCTQWDSDLETDSPTSCTAFEV